MVFNYSGVTLPYCTPSQRWVDLHFQGDLDKNKGEWIVHCDGLPVLSNFQGSASKFSWSNKIVENVDIHTIIYRFGCNFFTYCIRNCLFMYIRIHMCRSAWILALLWMPPNTCRLPEEQNRSNTPRMAPQTAIMKSNRPPIRICATTPQKLLMNISINENLEVSTWFLNVFQVVCTSWDVPEKKLWFILHLSHFLYLTFIQHSFIHSIE